MGSPHRRPAGAESLLTTLRDGLGLPGSKNACEQGECGSCSVILDGELVCSCLVMAIDADGSEIRTVEGWPPPSIDAVQEACSPPVGCNKLLHTGDRRGGEASFRPQPIHRRRDP
jgi:aerobic-type carbon monoxide dehydrogenase small subunit (CoxS/CutS family)